MDAKTFGSNVLIFRKERKLNQAQLAKTSGVSRNYISMIERGEAENVSDEIISRLAVGLGKNVQELTGDPGRTNNIIIPPQLREFAIEEGLKYEVVDVLRQMSFRGVHPKTKEEWKRLYDALAPFIDKE